RGGLLLALATVGVVLVGRRLVRHPWLSAACALLLLLAVVQPPPLTRVIAGWPPPGWRFAMCDVGQGDATVLAAGEGAGVVVDAGPDPVLVDRCLSSLGVTRVPLVLLTHFFFQLFRSVSCGVWFSLTELRTRQMSRGC
ncbi:MAG: hypothetical protein WCD21_18240, partial [Streptomyces sp.]